jgi:HK97 gp10 family phage protein
MDDLVIQVQGLSELNAKLEQLPIEVAKKLFRKALRAGGDVLKKEVVNRAPVKTEDSGPNSNSLSPGALKRGIKSRVSVKPEKGAGTVSIQPGKNEAHVARWLETGYTLTGHKPGKKQIKNIPAKPFFRPAVDSAGQKAIEAFTESLSENLNKLGEKSE